MELTQETEEDSVCAKPASPRIAWEEERESNVGNLPKETEEVYEALDISKANQSQTAAATVASKVVVTAQVQNETASMSLPAETEMNASAAVGINSPSFAAPCGSEDNVSSLNESEVQDDNPSNYVEVIDYDVASLQCLVHNNNTNSSELMLDKSTTPSDSEKGCDVLAENSKPCTTSFSLSCTTESSNTSQHIPDTHQDEVLNSQVNDTERQSGIQPSQESVGELNRENKCCNGAGEHFDMFDDLPPEIIQKIFSFLTSLDLCRAAQTCTKWRAYAYDPIHWQHLSFSWQVSPEERYSVIARAAPMLRSLSLHGIDASMKELEIIAIQCPRLEELDLAFSSIVETDVLKLLGQGLPELLSLNVEGCKNVEPSSVSVICNKFRKLQCLNLSYCNTLLNDSVVLIAHMLKHLRSLNTDGISWITDSAVESLVKHRGATLEHLELDGEELTDTSLRILAEGTRLKTLKIFMGELFTDEGLRYIKQMSALTSLTLRKGFNLSSSVLQNVFVGPQLSNLKFLDLTECSLINDDVVAEVTKCCGVKLIELTLSWCWSVTDKGLEAIVERCRSLRRLDITGLHCLKGHSLKKVPTNIPNLTYLNLMQCNEIDDATVLKVVEQKPDLVAINYYGEDITEFPEPQSLHSDASDNDED